ncbi:hypothetical protein NDU88_002157 [Pleurodeles waltl]|uniref:Uncharacterized protein n=1 Tax=Pleurodeles waltl TaxID=8319 RepID=A0AAV7NFL1_PLEWA|nr:hypothetical protein NDU88_002157 [Pleurodeles waltl]
MNGLAPDARSVRIKVHWFGTKRPDVSTNLMVPCIILLLLYTTRHICQCPIPTIQDTTNWRRGPGSALVYLYYLIVLLPSVRRAICQTRPWGYHDLTRGEARHDRWPRRLHLVGAPFLTPAVAYCSLPCWSWPRPQLFNDTRGGRTPVSKDAPHRIPPTR